MPLFKALPTGTIVGTSDTQTLSNKTFSDNINGTGNLNVLGSGGTSTTTTAILRINGPNATGSGGAITFQKNGSNRTNLGTKSGILQAGTSDNFIITNSSGVTSFEHDDATAAVTIRGTTTNDSAAAGFVGEIISSTVVSGSAVVLSTGAAKTITSISLTAGDWDVTANGIVVGTNASTAATSHFVSIGAANDTFDSTPGKWEGGLCASVTLGSGNAIARTAGPYRLSLSGTTTVYLIVQSAFTNTASGYGYIQARRMR